MWFVGLFIVGHFIVGFFGFSAHSYWVLCGIFLMFCLLWGFFIVGFLFIVGCGAFWFACEASSTLIESRLLWGFPLDLPVRRGGITS
jgi:hypothetical protein